MIKEEVIAALTKLGFPNRNCKVNCELNEENSLLIAKGKFPPHRWTEDVMSIEDRGLVTGTRSQRGHKSLTEWDKIISIE